MGITTGGTWAKSTLSCREVCRTVRLRNKVGKVAIRIGATRENGFRVRVEGCSDRSSRKRGREEPRRDRLRSRWAQDAALPLVHPWGSRPRAPMRALKRKRVIGMVSRRKRLGPGGVTARTETRSREVWSSRGPSWDSGQANMWRQKRGRPRAAVLNDKVPHGRRPSCWKASHELSGWWWRRFVI